MGGKDIARCFLFFFVGGGGERTMERALQNQFWRPQKAGWRVKTYHGLA